MATIIAARLQLQAQAEEAVEQLIRAGFPANKVTSFYLNPPGQHAIYPIGGDRPQSPGAEEAGVSVGDGAVVARIVEAIIGAPHSHQPIREEQSRTVDDTADQAENGGNTRVRRAGMMVAVELADPACQNEVLELLTKLKANDLEKAEGEIVNGQWGNFDPLSKPCFLHS